MNECDNQHIRGLRQRRRCGNALGRALGIQSAKAGPLDGQPPNGDVVLLGYGARCDTVRCRVKQNGERPVRLARPLLDRLPRTMRHLACAQHFVVVFGLRHERDRGAYAAFFAFAFSRFFLFRSAFLPSPVAGVRIGFSSAVSAFSSTEGAVDFDSSVTSEDFFSSTSLTYCSFFLISYASSPSP